MSATAMAASSGMRRMIAGMSLEPGELRGAPAALAGDDLVALRLAGAWRAERAHDDRLHDALRLDGVRQLLERFLPHVDARLVFAALEQIQRQLRQLVAGGASALAAGPSMDSGAGASGAGVRAATEQISQAATQRGLLAGSLAADHSG